MPRVEERSSLLTKKAARNHGCCRGYKFVSIRSKGALVALLLVSMRGFECFPFEGKKIVKPYVQNISYCLACLMFPVLGLYTDVRFGRHKTLLALTIARVFLSAIPLLLKLLSHVLNDCFFQCEVTGVIYTILSFINYPVAIWFAIVSFTFGLDQLLDAPSSELSVFIHWRFFGYAFIAFINYTMSNYG